MTELADLFLAARTANDEADTMLRAMKVVVGRVEKIVRDFAASGNLKNHVGLKVLATDVDRLYSGIVHLGWVATFIAARQRDELKKSLAAVEVAYVGHPEMGKLRESCHETLKTLDEADQVIAVMSYHAAQDVKALHESAVFGESKSSADQMVSDLLHRINQR